MVDLRKLKFWLWPGLLILIAPLEAKNPPRQLLPIKTCTLGTQSGHISAPDGPIELKFGLWLVLPIILVPEVKKNSARSAATTPNLESTLTLQFLRRPLILVGVMVSGHFLLSH